MAGSVQLLLKSTASSKSTKAAKPSPIDEAGEDFKAELNRANDRKNKPTEDSAEPKKTEKAASATKKSNKSKVENTGEEEPVEGAEEAVATSEKPEAAVAEHVADEVLEETPADEQAEDKPVAVKEKAVDANTPVVAMVAPQQQVAATTVAAVEQGGCESIDADGAAPAAAALPQVASVTQAAVPANDAASPVADPAVAAMGDTAEAIAIQPKTTEKPQAESTGAPADDAEAIAKYFDDVIAALEGKPAKEKPLAAPGESQQQVTPDLVAKATTNTSHVAKPEQIQAPPEVRFADNNHPEIVKSIQSELLPRGGTMQIRLDPPELGALQVTLTMKDGVMTASFQASSEDATRMLSHSMGQLKTAMESAGVTVDKLQVQHTPRDSQANNSGDDQQRHQPGQDDMSRQQEQQRKEMIKRMWRKLAGENDPLDMVA